MRARKIKSSSQVSERARVADPGLNLPSVEMLSKAKVTGQHPSASSTCLFICAFIFMSYWTMCRWMHLALLEKQNLSPPLGNWQRKITVPKWQRTGRAGTKSPRWRGQWKLDLILGLVKMTLPFNLGIKWIADSSINTFLKGAFGRPCEAEEQITRRLGRERLTQ